MRSKTDATVPAQPPTLFLLHGLGLSRTEWDGVTDLLGPDIRVVALDLAGFGANRSAAVTCREMADAVARRIAARPRPEREPDGSAPWMIGGHSMGGRIAMIVAGMAEGGAAGLDGLTHVVLVASSTLEPEPMDEEARTEMLGWVADGTGLSPGQAQAFVEDNTAGDLAPDPRDVALRVLAQADPVAWAHWLERGSREDWSGAVGLLHAPALILAGAEDGPLGEATQRGSNAPRFADATVRVIAEAAHLIPLERPVALAEAMRSFFDVDRPLAALPPEMTGLLTGPRVSARTRAAHLARVTTRDMPDAVAPYRAALAALTDAVLPGHADTVPDLVARVAGTLVSGAGVGWRFADLPTDEAAWPMGFAALDSLSEPVGGGFADLAPSDRDDLLGRIVAGTAETPGMTGRELSRWFEDMRARIVRAWVPHPATMARIGYDGFAQGGDGPRPQGYLRTAADSAESWQPVARGGR